jgi:hypothetical protein
MAMAFGAGFTLRRITWPGKNGLLPVRNREPPGKKPVVAREQLYARKK